MNPFTVAFEVNLCGRRRFAVQIHRLILDDVAFLGFEQEVRQRLWRVGGEGFGEFTQAKEIILIPYCKRKEKEVLKV